MIENIRELLSRDTSPLVQFIKYAVAGGIATATNIVLFQLIGWKLLPCLQKESLFVKIFRLTEPELEDRVRARNAVITNTIAFVVANFVAYVLNILFVFKAGRHPWYIEIALFYAVSGASFVMGTSLMGWLISKRGMKTDIAFGANIVTALLVNYAMRKFFIFQG